MTKKEAAIVMAYTGVAMLTGDDFSIFHEYIEKIMERPVFTHEMGNNEIAEKIKQLAKLDFIKICENLTD